MVFSMEYSFNYAQFSQQTSILFASKLVLHIYTILTCLSPFSLKQFEHENGFGMTNYSINLQTNQASQVLFNTQIIEMSLLSCVINNLVWTSVWWSREPIKLEINVADNFFVFDWNYSFHDKVQPVYRALLISEHSTTPIIDIEQFPHDCWSRNAGLTNSDCLKNLAPVLQPMRSKTKTKPALRASYK